MQYHAYKHITNIKMHKLSHLHNLLQPSAPLPTSHFRHRQQSSTAVTLAATCVGYVFAGKLFTACTKACTWASFTLHVLHKAITCFKMLRSNVVRLPLIFIYACRAICILVTTRKRFSTDSQVVHALLRHCILCLLHILLSFWDTVYCERGQCNVMLFYT